MMHDEDSDSFRSEEEEEQPPSAQAMISSLIKIDSNYVTSTWIGRVKVIQMLCAILAGCILPSAIGIFFSRYSFYTFVIWTCFMYIFLDFFLHVTSLVRLIPNKETYAPVLMYLLAIGALCLLISASLVASAADFQLNGWTQSTHNKNRTIFSAIFGYIVMALFIVEIVLRYQLAKNPPTESNKRSADIERQKRIEISGPIYKPTDIPPPYTGNGQGGGGGGTAIPLGGYA